MDEVVRIIVCACLIVSGRVWANGRRLCPLSTADAGQL